jgi:hypothetical protein
MAVSLNLDVDFEAQRPCSFPGTLSRLTGNMVFEKTALRAMDALWHHRSTIGLLGNHVVSHTK